MKDYKQNDNLKKVFEDTESYIINNGNNVEFILSHTEKNSITDLEIWKSKSNVEVVNEDCINVAYKFRYNLTSRICMLNMASAKRAGGGVRKGSRAQEEELCRRSNLCIELEKIEYPLKEDEYIYSRDIFFFKDSDYNYILHETSRKQGGFKCDIITLPAVNLNGKDKPENYIELTKKKIDSIFEQAIYAKCDILILSAFGCGVFKNDPVFIASCFKESINKYGIFFNKILFAILNDHNSVSDNFKIFTEILTPNE